MPDVLSTIMAAAITGIGSGLGTAIGSYLANRTLIDRMKLVEKKLKKKKKGG